MSNLRGGDTIGGYPIPGMLGTTGRIPKFNGPLITDSFISDDGVTTFVNGPLQAGETTLTTGLKINKLGTSVLSGRLSGANTVSEYFNGSVSGDTILRNETNTNILLGFYGASGNETPVFKINYTGSVETKNAVLDEGSGLSMFRGIYGVLAGNVAAFKPVTITGGTLTNTPTTPFNAPVALESRWYVASTVTLPQSMTVDLGALNYGIRAFSFGGQWTADGNSVPKGFTIYGSTDNSTWTTLYTKTGGGYNPMSIIRPTTIGNWRYIKVTITDYSQYKYDNGAAKDNTSISCFAVYTTDCGDLRYNTASMIPTGVTTWKDHPVNAWADAAIISRPNAEDGWIFSDQAHGQWGIYHRQIGTDLVVPGSQTLPLNSIAFIGNNDLQAYIALGDGTAFFKNRVTTGGGGLQMGISATATDNNHWVSDVRSAVYGARLYNGNYGAGTLQATFQSTGHIALGSQDGVNNPEGWSKVLDLYKTGNVNFTIRTAVVDARVMVHDSGWWSQGQGMFVGTATNHQVNFGQASVTRMQIDTSGRVKMLSNLVLPIYSGSDPGSPITGQIWVRSDL